MANRSSQTAFLSDSEVNDPLYRLCRKLISHQDNVTQPPVDPSSLLAEDACLQSAPFLLDFYKRRPHSYHVPRHAEEAEEIQATMHNFLFIFILFCFGGF